MLLVFFHVLFVIVAFGLTTGVGIALAAIGRSADVRAIRTGVRAGRPLTTAGGTILIVGILFGFASAVKLGFPLNSPWLTSAYIMALALLILGPGFFLPWQRRLLKAAEASPDDQPSAELLAIANGRAAAIVGPITGLLWIGLIYVMVVKP